MQGIREMVRACAQGDRERLTCTATVTKVSRISRHFIRIQLTSPGFDRYTPAPADAFRLLLPQHARASPTGEEGIPARVSMRAFTVHSFDRRSRTLEFDVLDHAHGLVANWLGSIVIGSAVEFIGIRREFALDPSTTGLVVIADACALPAASAVLGASAEIPYVHALLEVPHSEDFRLVPESVSTHWLVCENSSAGLGSSLEQLVLEQPPFPPGTQFWLAAESGVVQRIRRYLLNDCEIPLSSLHAYAYWKYSVTADERDARDLAAYTAASESGADVLDPEVVDRIEFGRSLLPEDTNTR
ncbi:NADPH-dependent ferric siderophore reductase [Rhodococcus sp. 27YEA15]|uniref:siderophore-interacting protein n=1 Tax=Rhodococcus sp. 27YEA15 TaxID=3156259 RepID=UPI003C7BCCCE